MKKEIKKLQDNNINENEDFQNSNQDFKKSEGKFTIISNDSIHKSNIKSDSIDIEESNNTLNDNKKFEEEDEEDDEFEEERIRAFNEIMNKKERPVEVIKEVDEEYDSDFHMSPVKINKDYHHENNNIHKNEQFAFKKLDYEINDNKKKNNNYSHFNEKDIIIIIIIIIIFIIILIVMIIIQMKMIIKKICIIMKIIKILFKI